jgi:hypothetical protein
VLARSDDYEDIVENATIQPITATTATPIVTGRLISAFQSLAIALSPGISLYNSTPTARVPTRLDDSQFSRRRR